MFVDCKGYSWKVIIRSDQKGGQRSSQITLTPNGVADTAVGQRLLLEKLLGEFSYVVRQGCCLE